MIVSHGRAGAFGGVAESKSAGGYRPESQQKIPPSTVRKVTL
jgi:hypothetical protein